MLSKTALKARIVFSKKLVRNKSCETNIPFFYSRLINAATYPAPNPLSIFTTLTFDAQEFIMPNKAASPLNAAPYPTLVGTAITGTPTSPPTTLGNAPSMPAQTITTRAWLRVSRFASRRWMPATPTSYRCWTSLPMISAVTTASSAIRMSLVPAETTAIVPLPYFV